MKFGTFHPTGAITCISCSSSHSDGDAAYAAKYFDGTHAAVCDHCGADIRLEREDVARCQALAKAFKDPTAGVWQTGGMCVAAGFKAESVKHPHAYVMATWEHAVEEGGDGWIVYLYLDEDSEGDEGKSEIATNEEALAYVDELIRKAER